MTGSSPDASAPSADACVIVPALDAESTLAGVIDGLRRSLGEDIAIFVVDDSSRDRTAAIARERGCVVVERSGAPRGKGSALKAGFEAALGRGKRLAVTVDADGQHPPDEARRVLFAPTKTSDDDAIVLGVRDLVRAAAPRANQISNGISNFFLSRFAGQPLADTQCGLRRYPIARTLALGAHGRGYDFEAEILLRAIWSGMEIVELPIEVLYPEDRTTHFRVSRDPWRIIQTVVATVGERWLGRAPDEPSTGSSRSQPLPGSREELHE